MNTEQQLKLQAFLDGELPEGEAREILAWTQRDDDAAALLAELRNTRQALAGAGAHLSVPENREFYWAKIERQIRGAEPHPVRVPRGSVFALLRHLWLPTGALAALLIAGLVIYPQISPRHVAATVADADEPVVETTLANSEATTYRDAGGVATLVWFTYASPARAGKPTDVN